MSLPNNVLTGSPEMAEDHHILGTGGPLGQCPKKFISNPDVRLHCVRKYKHCSFSVRYWKIKLSPMNIHFMSR